MRGSRILVALAAPVFACGIMAVASPALADDPHDPTMTPQAIARDRAIIRRLNQEQLASVRKRDAQYQEGWKAYKGQRRDDDGGSQDYADARRQYDADLAQWRRDVSACRAGDYSRCR